LPDIQADCDAMGCIGGDSNVVAQGIVTIAMAHDPRLRIGCADPGLPLPRASIARALGLSDLLDIDQRLLEPLNPLPPGSLTGRGLPGCFLLTARISHGRNMLPSRSQMLPDLLLLLERAWSCLRGDLRAVVHDGLQGHQSLRTQDPENLREDLVQRVMVGQAKVGKV
jgi:hypothetical protein